VSTDTIEKPDTITTDAGDHDRFAHFVRKGDILASAWSGVPVIALCGKRWVPGRDPEKFPVCPECEDIINDDRKLLDNDA
jgi:hypothetical protein